MIEKIKNIFKKKEPKIEFWSKVQGLADIEECKPKPAKYFFPDWISKVPSKVVSDIDPNQTIGTIKRCPVIPEFLSQGYIIPMWCDTILKCGEDSTQWAWKTSDSSFSWTIHPNNQFLDYLPEHMQDKMTFKANCPWVIKTSPGYSVYQFPLLYHFYNNFTILSGSIRTDMYHEINQQVLIKNQSEIFIPRGTPFAWYIPYKREKYTHTVKDADQVANKWITSSSLNITSKFAGAYKLKIKSQQQDQQLPANKY